MYIKIHSEAFKNTYLSGFKCLTAFEHEEWLQECKYSNMVFNALKMNCRLDLNSLKKIRLLAFRFQIFVENNV
jgi:hypothetical protein